MDAKLKNIINLRHKKRDLYVELLKKGLNNLSTVEKNILTGLSLDDDIILLLKNGMVFDILESK